MSHKTLGAGSRKGKRFQATKLATIEARKWRLPDDKFFVIVREIFAALGSPVALRCWLRFSTTDHVELLSTTVNPGSYNDPRSFGIDYASENLLRKSQFLRTGINKKEVALAAFDAAEVRCAETNARFKDLASDPLFSGHNVYLLSLVERKIAKILGVGYGPSQTCEASGFSPEEFFSSGGWGPGVTQLVKGENTSAPRKFSVERELTEDLFRIVLPAAKMAYPLWLGGVDDFIVNNTSKVITVPKNAKTDRTIAVEPGLNVWFQKACGKMIRRRLRRAGYDLNTDEKNKEMARVGSRTGEICTVDFSAASDTVSLELVRALLPQRWFTLLDVCRTKKYRLKGETRTFHKFSSMGNGFTFELESLIFIAAAEAVCELMGESTDSLSIFGDDVTMPSSCFDVYAQFCAFLGFTVNRSKSFSQTYFRESCGSYYFAGVDVKPLYLQKQARSLPEVYDLHNQVRRLGETLGVDMGPVLTYILKQIPSHLCYFGPVSLGRSVLHVSVDDERFTYLTENRRGRKPYTGNWLITGLYEQPVVDEDDSHGVLVARLADAQHGTTVLGKGELRSWGFGNEIPLRQRTRLTLNKQYLVRPWTCELLI